MFRLLVSAALAALIAAPLSALAASVAPTQYDVLTKSQLAVTATAGQKRLRFAASGRTFELELELNTALLNAFGRPDDRLYRGRIAGVADSWVRVSERDGALRGMLFDGSDYYAIEPTASLGLGKNPSTHAFYALKDLAVNAGELACGSTPLFANARTDLNTSAKAIAAELTFIAEEVATQQIDLSLIGDSDFASGRSDPTADMMDRFNIVDGIFSDQVGVTLNITEVRITDAGTEPFTTTDASDLLDELATLRFNDPALRSTGLTHLYTGRNLDGTTAGIAFRGALCSSRFGAGLSEGRRNLTTDSLIAAHELGHNFGAPHDNEPGSVCSATPGGFLMAPSINGSNTFSACSLNEIQQEVASASCLTSIQPIDVLPILRGFPADATVGTSFNGTIDVSNNGATNAGAVTLAVTPSANISVTAASLPAGCAATPTGAECTLASLSASATETFVLGFTPIGPGNATIDATTTTANDANAGNDDASVNLAVTAVIDLAAAISGPATLATGTDATFTPRAQNLSPDPASDVELVIDVTAGLDIVSVAGPCTQAASQVTCRQTTLAGSSSVDFPLVLRGADLGAQTLTTTVSASDADPNAANDTASFNVTVNDPVVVDADVSVSLSGPSALDTDDPATYFAAISNQGPATATGVSLSATIPGVLTITSVDNTDCTVAGTEVTCALADMPAQDSVSIGIVTNGASAGSGNVTATVTTGSPDPATADNSDSLSVTVSAAPVSTTTPANDDSGGGGGGSVTWLWLLAGLLTVFRRRVATPAAR